ncbi:MULTISPECIES: FG-GAP-like repeat-containing protein [unclassified Nocardioides]|uniref:FG-GAP-like repeat-containing protein n=1 Tax=unclassified Nocardioides TaxID=2615069 RepID=UPI000702C1BA|nr:MULTISPECIES: FG-GAP-like repeat-containing protein [unclassified Nocardioides]KRC46279.1 hypothetical protein ASE19_20780 [Nocardioides sp. Root79]KRC69626.1 hypothetical protein ASE20_13640 [Nocardioides sp. Root240]
MSSYLTERPERSRRLRFVTLSQQLLALAVVVAVLTPAARTVTMDVRPAQPVDVVPSQVALQAAPVEVPTAPVDAEVDQYALTTSKGASASHARTTVRGSERATAGGGEVIDSDVVPVEGYGTVGVTWAPGSHVADDAIDVKVRTRTGNAWSGWTDAEYHDEHGPDPRTAEGRNARPGTDALLVGEVDAVQVKVTTDDGAPADMKLAVIDPGKADRTATEQPAIDTAKLATSAADGTDGTDPVTPTDPGTDDSVEQPPTTTDDLSLQAGVFTPKPKIYSRAQWGADESLRDKPSLSYYEVHAGFVHHTVNANNYTADQVPGIIRGIYSYHVRTRGWSDIGYNFLVDKFGRIWEGRYGGVDRPVVGAHTQGYNQYSFAMSAIGNYDVARPSSAMVTAYAQLFAWKLSLHGVSAGSTAQRVGSKTFQAINGHRDAGQTACPGKYLYAMIPTIRTKAQALQKSWRGRDVESNFTGSALPDLVLRRKGDGRGVIAPVVNVDGRYKLAPVVDTGRSFAGLKQVWRAGDWDRDGKADVLGQRTSDGALVLFRGLGDGKLAAPTVIRTGTSAWRLIAPVGDMTGDGWPDLMAEAKSGAAMRIIPGRGLRGFGNSYPAYSAVTGSAHIAAGRWNKEDGAPDSIVRNGSKLTVYFGNGPGGWTSTRLLPQTADGYDRLVGVPSVNGDWHSDLVARTTAGKYYLLKGTATSLAAPVPLATTTTYDLMG